MAITVVEHVGSNAKKKYLLHSMANPLHKPNLLSQLHYPEKTGHGLSERFTKSTL
jgi:hypothetical protein